MIGVNLSTPSPLRRICVFCGSAFGNDLAYRESAETFARLLAENCIGIVYGGASVGLMGVVADAALAAGGEVIGVLPHSMMAREIGHSGLTELHLVDSLHERKAMMADLSDAFVALPGGLGTLEEIFEACSWAQIGLHRKPCAFLNTGGFYDGLMTFLDTTVMQGFVRRESRDFILSESDPHALLQRLRNHVVPVYDRWTGVMTQS